MTLVNGRAFILARQAEINSPNRPIPDPWYSINTDNNNYLNVRRCFYFDRIYNSPIYLNIFSFNLRNPTDAASIIFTSMVIEAAGELYMSEKGIYIAT